MDHLKDDSFKAKVSNYQHDLASEICADIPNAFWNRKKHIVALPYIDGFDEKFIPTKARPIQMNERYLKLCQKEISDLLEKGLIRIERVILRGLAQHFTLKMRQN